MMNQVVESNINQKTKKNASKSIEVNKSKNETKKEGQVSKQKKIIKITSVGIAGLSALKLASAQASLLEATIVKSTMTFLNTKSICFLGVLGIPNYLLIALVISGAGISYFTLKDTSGGKGKRRK